MENKDYRKKEEKKMSRDNRLHFAATNGHLESMKALLEAGAHVNDKDEDGGTPLHWAAYKGHGECVTALLGAGADVNINDNYGLTPLHWAAYYGRGECVTALLEAGAYVNAKNNMGKTPLHFAACNRNGECVKTLLKAGAYVNAKDNRGKTPLDYAYDENDEKMQDILSLHFRKLFDEMETEECITCGKKTLPSATRHGTMSMCKACCEDALYYSSTKDCPDS
jgi:ankyrin repeat protein